MRLLCLTLGTFAAGCAATTVPVRVVERDAFDAAARDRDVVLACTIEAHELKPNYAAGERGMMPAMVIPKAGYLSRVTLRVDGVVRGSFDADELVIDHARADAATTQPEPFAVGSGRPVWLAFDNSWLRGRHDYVLAPRDHE